MEQDCVFSHPCTVVRGSVAGIRHRGLVVLYRRGMNRCLALVPSRAPAGLVYVQMGSSSRAQVWAYSGPEGQGV